MHRLPPSLSTKSRQKTCDEKVCMSCWSTRNCTRHIIRLQRLALRLSFQQSEVAIPSEIFISLCGKIFFPLASFIYKINQKLMKSILKFEIELNLLVYKWKVPNLIIWDIIWPSLTPSLVPCQYYVLHLPCELNLQTVCSIMNDMKVKRRVLHYEPSATGNQTTYYVLIPDQNKVITFEL